MPSGWQFLTTWQFWIVTVSILGVAVPFGITVAGNLVTPKVADYLKERTEKQERRMRKRKRLDRARSLSEIQFYSKNDGYLWSQFASAIAIFSLAIGMGFVAIMAMQVVAIMKTVEAEAIRLLWVCLGLALAMGAYLAVALSKLRRLSGLFNCVASRNVAITQYRDASPNATPEDVRKYLDEEDRMHFLMTGFEADVIANGREGFLENVLKSVTATEKEDEENQRAHEEYVKRSKGANDSNLNREP